MGLTLEIVNTKSARDMPKAVKAVPKKVNAVISFDNSKKFRKNFVVSWENLAKLCSKSTKNCRVITNFELRKLNATKVGHF